MLLSSIILLSNTSGEEVSNSLSLSLSRYLSLSLSYCTYMNGPIAKLYNNGESIGGVYMSLALLVTKLLTKDWIAIYNNILLSNTSGEEMSNSIFIS